MMPLLKIAFVKETCIIGCYENKSFEIFLNEYIWSFVMILVPTSYTCYWIYFLHKKNYLNALLAIKSIIWFIGMSAIYEYIN